MQKDKRHCVSCPHVVRMVCYVLTADRVCLWTHHRLSEGTLVISANFSRHTLLLLSSFGRQSANDKHN